MHHSQIISILAQNEAFLSSLTSQQVEFCSKIQLKTVKKYKFVPIVYFSLTILLYNMYIQLFAHIFMSNSIPNGAFDGTKHKFE